MRAVLVGDEGDVELLGLHLAHQPIDRLVLRHETRRAHELGDRLSAVAAALGAHQILRVRKADDVLVVRLAASTGTRLKPCAIATSSACGDGHRIVERDHVGPWHHHLASHGVAELDDALDQLALLVLDHLRRRPPPRRCRATPTR